MAKERHLTEEALLELAGERLSGADWQEATQHIEACASCRDRFANLKFAHSVFERLAEVGINEVSKHSARPALTRKPRLAFPRTAVLAVSFGFLAILGFCLSLWVVPEVRASELLSDAMRKEQPNSTDVAYRVQAGGRTCANRYHGRDVVFMDVSGSCGHVLKDMQATVWEKGNPLSVRTYATWHSSLRRRRDSVERQGEDWEIRTTTDDGIVHAASLEMRSSDYHPTKLTLDFDDAEEVSIVEDTDAKPPAEAANDLLSPQLELQQSSDALEVHAWAILHQLNADSGWRAIVLRRSEFVAVKAIAETEEQKEQILTAFVPYPAVGVEVRSDPSKSFSQEIVPQRAGLQGYAPGLAEKWLERNYPDADERMTYSNRVLSLSQHILGRAFYLDKLRRRQETLANCACAKEMQALIVAEQQSMNDLQQELYAALAPLMSESLKPARDENEPGQQKSARARSHALSFAQAQKLDAALELLLSGSTGPDEAALKHQVEIVRRILSADRQS